jgi:hypothetical protein
MLNKKKIWLFILFFTVLAVQMTIAAAAQQAPSQRSPDGGGTISGELRVWHPVTVSFNGPSFSETQDYPNPFLDYRLQLTFTGPSGQNYLVPGYFAGDGQGGSSGDVWQAHFSPDEAGQWHYAVSFRTDTEVAISLDPGAGWPTAFDGETGTLTIEPRDPQAAGFLKYGRLEYVGGHYLKFRDGPYWIKGGTDSPENFLGYAGFDDTHDQGGIIANFTHEYPSHVADARPTDPYFVGNGGVDSRGITGALNYLASQHVNSIYFLPMNLGGDGQETFPFISAGNNPYAKTHYDLSKLYQWGLVLDHAQRQGIALHFVLAETEPANEMWLDNGQLGIERKLFFRELIARYSHLLAIKWNLCEENDYSVPLLQSFASYFQALDPYDHPIAVHTNPNDPSDYHQLLGDPRFSATSWQYWPSHANLLVESWRDFSAAAGRKWVLDMDENTTDSNGSNADYLRKDVLYDVYFSGGNVEWYAGYHDLPIGGDVNLEDFRTREAMWRYTWYARRFVSSYLPFWEMAPNDDLLSNESGTYGGGEVLAKPGVVYAIYLPEATSTGTFNLTGHPGLYSLSWYNPRTGQFQGVTRTVAGGQQLAIGQPPAQTQEDWVVLIKKLYTGAHFSYLPALWRGN